MIRTAHILLTCILLLPLLAVGQEDKLYLEAVPSTSSTAAGEPFSIEYNLKCFAVRNKTIITVETFIILILSIMIATELALTIVNNNLIH